MDEILKIIASIQQSRSNFELEHFVLGQHDTIEMAYYQTALEIQDTVFKIKNAELEVQKINIEMSRLIASGDEIDAIIAQQKRLVKEQTEIAMVGANRELEHLLKLWDAFPIKYNREQIELGQGDYWRTRLDRQAGSQVLGQGFVDMAQIDALRQVGILEEFIEARMTPVITEEKEAIE
jgi:hypothetical protein